MPIIDGYQTVRKLRGRGYGKPIIALTASVMDDAHNRCLKAGCDGYLSKPFKQEELYALLAKYLSVEANGAIDGGRLQESWQAQLEADPGLAVITLRFVDHLQERIDAIVAAAQQKMWPEVRDLAHKLACAQLFGFSLLWHNRAVTSAGCRSR